MSNNDLISREALKKILIEEYEAREHYIGEKMLEAIDNAPTVADRYDEGYAQGYVDGSTGADWKESIPYEEKLQGEWIKIFENPFTNGYICSLCGHKIQVTEQFLPEVTECEGCGAEMKGGNK